MLSSSVRETLLSKIMLSTGVSILLSGLLLGTLSSPTHAQSRRAGDVFYGKLGGGISDYTGDLPAGDVTHPFDLQEFVRGSGLPFMVTGEIGYQFSPKWSLALGVQAGNYPIAGLAGIGGISDSYRYAPQLLGRYTFGRPGQIVAPYIDLGINLTFGGDRPPTSTGVGPSVGGGVDILLSQAASFYVESRLNLAFPDEAVDGAATKGSFDSTNQLLGFGLKVTFTTPTAPRILRLTGPVEVKTGTSVTFAATINEGKADRPVDYQWDFGDGETDSGLTATHTFDRPGTYAVSFSASNRAGEASRSITVTAERPPKPPQIASISAAPDSVAIGTSVQFSGAAEGSSPLAYEWRFGDGATVTGPSPTHTYTTPGEYTARLSVSNEAGTEARTVTVRVARRAGQNQADPEQANPGQAIPKQKEGWGIVVASIREESEAETVARRYRDQFSTASMPVGTVAAETDQGPRYRVVVGAFEDADAARQAMEERKENLPSGAWLLRLD
jgi:PKD repeat protein